MYFEIKHNKAILIFKCRNEAARIEAWNANQAELEQIFSAAVGEIDHVSARNPQNNGARYIRFKYHIFPGVNDAAIFDMMKDHYEATNRILLGQ